MLALEDVIKSFLIRAYSCLPQPKHFQLSVLKFWHKFSFSTYLSKAFVKQRLRSVSMYLLQASTARGFDRTVVIETIPA